MIQVFFINDKNKDKFSKDFNNFCKDKDDDKFNNNSDIIVSVFINNKNKD